MSTVIHHKPPSHTPRQSGYDVTFKNASRPFVFYRTHETRRKRAFSATSLRQPDALTFHGPYISLRTRNPANPFVATADPDCTHRHEQNASSSFSKRRSTLSLRLLLRRSSADVLACNRAQIHRSIAKSQSIQRAHSHSPKVHPPSLLNLCLASTSLRISSSVNRSAPAQFALLVLDLNR